MSELVPPGRRERRAELARRGIVAAAGEVLSEGGIRSFTIEAIAERADVAVQTVYNRVGGRSALLLAVTQQAVAENRRFVDPAYESEGPPEARIRMALRAYVRFAAEMPHQFRIVTSPPDDPQVLRELDELISFHMRHLTAALQEAVSIGTFRSDIDPAVAATALWAMCSGILSLGLRASETPVSEASLSLMVDFFEDMVLRGITVQEP